MPGKQASKVSVADRIDLVPLAAGVAMAGDDVLACPGCGSENLHHETVLVFSRQEDAENVRRTIVMPDGRCNVGVVKNDMSGNPSSRRDGLTIMFWCECCDTKPMLCVAQHKGSTQIYWSIMKTQTVTVMEGE